MRNGAQKLGRLKSIRLANWRNFQHVNVPLSRRVFLIGPNASGKSNLLDAIRFLHDLVAVGGGLQSALTKRGGISKLRCLAARQYSDISVAVETDASEDGQNWQYELVLNQDSQRRGVIKREMVTHGAVKILSRPNEDDRADPERLTQTSLEQLQANQKFRAIAAFFAQIRYLHIVPQLVREPDRSVGRIDDPYGGDFLEQIAKTQPRTQRARLRRIQRALSVAVPQLNSLELTRDERGTPHLRGNYQHWRPKGAWQTEEDFSDGTLRLLGLLWAVLDGSGPLLLEEPELSLHTEVIRQIPQLFARLQRRSGRQIITSTHSATLIDDTGVGIDEVVVLQPTDEGTTVQLAAQVQDVKALLDDGLSLGEAVMPHTRPEMVEQLMLFGDEAWPSK